MSSTLRGVSESKFATMAARTLSSVFHRVKKRSHKENVAPGNTEAPRKAKGRMLGSLLKSNNPTVSPVTRFSRLPLGLRSEFDFSQQFAPPLPTLPLGSADARLAVLNGATTANDLKSQESSAIQASREQTVRQVSPAIPTARAMRDDLECQMRLLEANFGRELASLGTSSHAEEVIVQEMGVEVLPRPIVRLPVTPGRISPGEVASWRSPLEMLVTHAAIDMGLIVAG
ncbi:hypothetical protein FRB97_000348 [Tulasnella sp. 331]|nr:hypothetical protein FRB97_000348 [Tulasnella sp. 331]